MRRTHQALATLALGLVLIGATTAIAAAATPPTRTQDQGDQRKALYQSEQERTLARHRALGALDNIAGQPAIAAQPAARTDRAAPSPGVDVLATLLIGLVGGLLGGAAVMVGWAATTRRRRPRDGRRHLSRRAHDDRWTPPTHRGAGSQPRRTPSTRGGQERPPAPGPLGPRAPDLEAGDGTSQLARLGQ